MISKISRILFVLIVNAWAITVYAQGAVALDRVAVVVNNGVITEQQIQEQMNLMRKESMQLHTSLPSDKILHQQAMDHLIDIELQRDMAKVMQIDVTDQQLDLAIADIAKKNGATIAQLKDKIQEEGLSYDKYRKMIRDQMVFGELQRKQLGGSINVTEQEVKDAIAANPNIGKSVSAYHVEDWLVPMPDDATPEQIAQTKQLAMTINAELKKSAASNNPTVLHSDLGMRELNGFPDIFIAVIPRLNVGEISAPIQAGNGFHLLRVIEIRGNQAAQTVVETHARHILIKTNALTSDDQVRERLGDLLVKLNHGEDFAKIAQVNSQDLVSAANGGDLGWMTSDKLDPAFASAMDKLKVNEFSAPIKSQFGWHIIQVLGRRNVDNKNPHYALAKEWVFHKKVEEAVTTWLKQLRSQAYIKITDAKST